MFRLTRYLAITLFACAGAASMATDFGKIMFVGNSYAESHQSDNLTNEGGYRKVIEDLLLADGHTFDFVGNNTANSAGMRDPDNNGYGGKVISDILNGVTVGDTYYGNLAEWVQKDMPDIMVVELGRAEYDPDINVIKNSLRGVLDTAYGINSNMRIMWNEQVIASPDLYDNIVEKHALINQAINELAQEYTDRGFSMDVSKVSGLWDAAVDLDTDGVHPSQAGYEKLGLAHYRELTRFEPNPAVPEPASMILVAAGAGFAVLRRRKAARA